MADEIHYEMTGSPRNTEYTTKSDLIKHLEGFGYVKEDILTYEDLLKEL